MSTEQADDSSAPLTKAQLAFRDCHLKVQTNTSAERLWDRLSDQDRQRLGNDLEAAWRPSGTAGMWMRLNGVSFPRAVIETGQYLNHLTAVDFQWLLREMGEFSDPEEAFEAAIAAGDLVLIERPRSSHWDGSEIAIDWNRYLASWEFLWELSRCAKSGQPLDNETFGETAAHDIVARRKCRLINAPGFPISLANLIEPMGRGTQQLRLPRERIRIFVQSASGTAVEWYP